MNVFNIPDGKRLLQAGTSLKAMVFVILITILPVFGVVAAADIGVEEIIFASRHPGAGGHWYENFGYYSQDENKMLYGSMGRLCRLNIASGNITILLDDPEGAVRDPQVHYDCAKILFSYRPGGTAYFHLYEINIDGSGL